MTEARAFEIIPAIDLRGGRVVRLRRGDFDQEQAYDDDPAGVASRFADSGARWLHVVDLDGARSGSPSHLAVMAEITAAVGDRLKVEVAGGLRDSETVAAALRTAARVIVGTAALRDPSLVGRLIAHYGTDRIGVAIDVRDGRALGGGWATDAVGFPADEAVDRLADVGVEVFVVTAIDRDGLLDGPDIQLLTRLVGLGRGTIIASGGITTLDDLRSVRATGCVGAIIGRALYEGRLDLAEAISVTR